MYKINVKHETSSTEQMVETLRHIATQIEEGYTSGYYPTWELTNQTQKEEKIDYIKGVIQEWGSVSTSDLVMDSSPVFNSINKDHYMLVERFYNDCIEVVEYINETEVDTHRIVYEELDNDLIDEICIIIENYEADCLKTEKRISN